MPSSPDIDLEELKKKIKNKLGEKKGEIQSIQEDNVAFGLKALIVTMSWPEEKGTDKAEQLCKVEGVNSVQTIDFRRAVG